MVLIVDGNAALSDVQEIYIYTKHAFISNKPGVRIGYPQLGVYQMAPESALLLKGLIFLPGIRIMFLRGFFYTGIQQQY